MTTKNKKISNREFFRGFIKFMKIEPSGITKRQKEILLDFIQNKFPGNTKEARKYLFFILKKQVNTIDSLSFREARKLINSF